MRFEWDDRKNELNRRKHDVAFETATMAFDDPLALTQPDIRGEDEERWITLGAIEPGLLLFVVHTHFESEGEEVIRIISARKAQSAERKLYEDTHKDAKRGHQKASRKTRRRH